jgi:TonB-linked SusC/RagA family outer membrane protein
MGKILTFFFVLMVFWLSVFSQQRIVNGRIVDSLGLPVPFVSVRIKGTNVGVSGDADGHFTIEASPTQTLIISGTGIMQKEVLVGNSPNLMVQVSSKVTSLSEVVVTGLGINKQIRSLGYSTAKVSGNDLVVAKPISVANGLTGKVSGLEINTINNGLFAPTRITLRGNRSLLGYNQPLIVVDGSIFYNDISTLNPEDIESINTLKGASASAIYGSDASNGVMVVSTKHGITAKPVVIFSTTTQFETVAYLPTFQQAFGGNGGEIYVYNFHDLSTYVPMENWSYGPLFNGKIVPVGRPLEDGSLDMLPYSAIPNQKKDFFNTGVTETINLSYSAGDEKGRFYIGVQDVYSKNPMPGDMGRRDVFRVGGARTYGIFSADFSVSYTYQYKDITNTSWVYTCVLNTPANIPLSNLKNWASYKYATLDGYFADWPYNPYWVAANQRNQTTDNSIQGNLHFQLKPTKWLTLSYRLAANNMAERYEYKQAEAVYSQYSMTNDTIFFTNSNGSSLVPNTNFGPKLIALINYYPQPQYNTYTSGNFLLTSDFLATFVTKFNQNFDFNANLGTSYIDNQITYLGVNANSLFFPVYNVNSLTGIPGISQFYGLARKLGFFGDAQVGYKGFAFLHGSYRADEDSRLSSINKWIPYYDIDASLILSEIIRGIKNSSFMDYLKFRGAYSVTGNATSLASGQPYLAAGAYQTTPTLNSVSGFPYSGLGGYQLTTNVTNPNIKPEQVEEVEAGLEFGFLNGRISLGGDVYEQKLSDGIIKASLPYSSGYATALLNAANTKNKGYEIDLKGDIIQTRNWVWRVNVNYSHNECTVKSINGSLTSLNISSASGSNFKGQTIASNPSAYAVVGQLFPVIEGNDWVRDPQGQVIVNAATGLPSISSNLSILGNSSPMDVLGLSTSVSWKAFTLTATADYRGGYKTYNSIGDDMAYSGVSTYTTQTDRQPFVWPNSVIDQGGGKYIKNTNITVNDAAYNLFTGLFAQIASPYVQSAAAWKLREVALSYIIPIKVFGHQNVIKQIAFAVSARNLLMFRPKTNLWTDPEFSEDTSNATGYNSTTQAPPTRIWGATLAVTF